MQNLLDILSNSNKDIDNQKLMDYLGGKLSEEEKHEVEKWMVDNDFAGDAWEGLKDLSRKKDLSLYVDELNRELSAYIRQKKNKRVRQKISQPSWIYVTIFLLLLLIIVAYFIISRLGK
ncbi:MAG TPA: hypothetical protein VM012_09815 [Flavitalea sp.]|nr:hypothetical protein [Flavitalea sp.]